MFPLVALLLAQAYPWLAEGAARERLETRFPPPAGYAREPVDGFAAWLRGLPLLPGRPAVLLHDGRPKGNQEAHAAVVDLDVGRRNLQQCADAVMRLRAEYLFAAARSGEIAFSATSGDTLDFARWARGDRPRLRGARLVWGPGARGDASHASLRRYLDVVFTYAGSQSLSRELRRVPLAELAAGDVFVQGGFPGHAVLVVDVARDPASGRRVFLLAQSYMPAQQVHVLRSPGRRDAWYPLEFTGPLVTPEWTFAREALHRF